MSRSSFSTEGIILSRKNYGEADRILTIFTKHYGKIFLLAKGVRKPKSRKRGHIEIFSRVRFSYTKNSSFVLMNEAELVDSFQDVRSNLKKTALAFYFIEVIANVLPMEEKNVKLYNLLEAYLKNMKSVSRLKDVRLSFLGDVLTELGFWPRGKKLDDPDRVIKSVLERQINSERVGKKILQ